MLRKVRNHVRLLRDDPEKFAANVLQFTNPARFQEKLVDILTAAPLHVSVDIELNNKPALNVLQPILSPASMTGGPNTIVNVAFRVAQRGIPVRIVTTRQDPSTDPDWFWDHLSAVTGDPSTPPTLTVAPAIDPTDPLPIGANDVFLATHWTTAQQVKTMLPRMNVRRFFYLIQDFEPGFYTWSSNYALALETYDLDFIAVFNERFLFDYLIQQRAGRFADPELAANSLIFEPAIDSTLFHPPAAARNGPKRLLFYTRPTNPRNMLGLGLTALRIAITDAMFGRDAWEFVAIGSRGGLPDITLRPNQILRTAPWVDYASYGRQLRDADILLCPMLSPHTSYPVLEMAASGGIVVTNSFGPKTPERLQAISENIVAVKPTVEGFTAGLIDAARRVTAGYDREAPLNLPRDWNSALSDTAERMTVLFREITTS